MRSTQHLTLVTSVALLTLGLSIALPSLAEDTNAADTNAADTEAGTSESSGPGRITVPFTGAGLYMGDGTLSISPHVLEAGLVEIGKSSSHVVTITHSGGQDADPIAIQEATMFGKSVGEFTSDFTGFKTLMPGESVSVNVDFTPRTPGDKSAGMRMHLADSTRDVVLVFEGESRYPLTSKLLASTDQLSLGEVFVNGVKHGTLTFSNDGVDGAPVINLQSIQLSGVNADAFSTDFSPVAIVPGESHSIQITLDTSQQGAKSAKLTMLHDGLNDAIQVGLSATVNKPGNIPVSFSKSELNTNFGIENPTSIQFGPDGKLYVAEKTGAIHVIDVTRNGKNNYSGTKIQTINHIKNVPNHNDDGSNSNQKGRLVTGILVTGTAQNPVIYAASSDPRMGGGDKENNDTNLDTNSGILHKLTKNGNDWAMQDLVRGLPRSEENHAPNGLVKIGSKIYLNVGGHTNIGSPSHNFVGLPEYALSAATLEIDLAVIGNSTYDLPTLDDEDRSGTVDENDPFGGNNGKNQAILEADGPVRVFASGLRNAFDIVYTQAGNLYTWDNGPNFKWGDKPPADCSNTFQHGLGVTKFDGLHKLSDGYYAGHPNPTRGNKANTFNATNPQSPIQVAANPEECVFQIPGEEDGSLIIYEASTNGIDEYTASNFAGSMMGDIIAAAYDGTVRRVVLNANGTKVTSHSKLDTLPQNILDLTTQGDAGPFPGTIWVTNFFEDEIIILEPSDY